MWSRRFSDPVAHSGGRVVDPRHPPTGSSERIGIGQVAFDPFDAQAAQEPIVGPGANQGPHRAPAAHQLLHDVTAQQAGTAGDQIQRVVGSIIQDVAQDRDGWR